MENPKCPYCWSEMQQLNTGNLYHDHVEYSYWCPNCRSGSPVKMSPEEAHAAAMKRDGAKGKAEGKWIWDTSEGWECRCSRCGEPLPILTDSNDEFICKANYCPNCGAEIKEISDE